MKSLDEMIAVMEASKTKQIEVRPLENNLKDEWFPPTRSLLDNAFWNWAQYDYRVKPEIRQPARIVVDNGSVLRVGSDSSIFYRSAEFIELTPEVRAKLGL